jgi:acyl dehydratase
MFDGSKRMTLSGTVREFQWSNPHSYIQLVVKSPDRTEQEWSLEMGANAYLYNLGWRPSTVKPGDTLTVKIDPLRNGSRGGLVVEAQTADGKTLGRRP